MNDDLLENLLHQDESETLDFKLEQYPFDKATDDEKSELLKDILAFANSWRQTDAYILIGVKEVKGGRSKVIGIRKHLLNRNLQQFVNSKNMSNRPIEFSYKQYLYKGMEIGIIEIKLQMRPFFLRKKYGKCEANWVYIRRGDTTAIANPDEVARMGSPVVTEAKLQPELDIQFAEIKNRQLRGTKLSLVSKHVTLPDLDSIPLYGEPETLGSFTLKTHTFENRNYYRDIAKYINKTAFLTGVGFAIRNTSNVLAKNVHVKVKVNYNPALDILDEYDGPSLPSTDHLRITKCRPLNQLQEKALIEVRRHGNLWEITSDFGDIQPGATIWTKEEFYIGAKEALAVEMNVHVVANNLSKPFEIPLTVKIDVKSRPLQEDDINNFIESNK